VAVALWASAWIGCYISLWWCVLLGYVGAFTVPVAYQACKGQLTAVAQVIRTHTVVSFAARARLHRGTLRASCASCMLTAQPENAAMHVLPPDPDTPLQDRVDATGLPRTARFLFLVAAVAALWCTSSFTQSAIGFFVALAYWRTLLAPREVCVLLGGGGCQANALGTPGGPGAQLATKSVCRHADLLPSLGPALLPNRLT
jgi:hypothetical protein